MTGPLFTAAWIFWSVGVVVTASFIVAGYVIFHEEDDMHLTPGFALRGVVLCALWPVFWLQHAVSARSRP